MPSRTKSVRSKSPRQLDREIAEALGSPSQRRVPGYSNYGGGGAFAPMGGPSAQFAPMGGPSAQPRKKSRAVSRRGHAAKKTASTKAGTTDKITIDQLAEMFGLPNWDKIDEMN